jgi:hypothetical protein
MFVSQVSKRFLSVFSHVGKLVHNNNADSLIEVCGQHHESIIWRVIIDCSNLSFKAVLLYNGYKYPSVPVAHVIHMKESYDSMHHFVKLVQHDGYIDVSLEIWNW